MQNSKLEKLKIAFKAAFPCTIPVLMGFLVLGAAYGVLMKSVGYNVFWAVLMSAICFCGSMQLVAIDLITTAFNPLQTFLMSIMVNARHLFYGFSMLPNYKSTGKVKPFLVLTLCDETFSILTSTPIPKGVEKRYFYFFVSFLNYIYWSMGGLIGGLVGEVFTFNTKGLDFVLTALMIVLFIEQLKSKDNVFSGCIGVVSSITAILIFGTGNMVIPAMVIILIILIGRKKLCR